MSLEVAVVKQQTPSTTGTIDFTSSGFGTPTAAMFFLVWGSTDGAIRNNHQFASIGYTDLTNERCSSISAHHNAVTTKTNRHLISGSSVAQIDQTDGSINKSGSFNSTITDGLRLDWTVSSGSAQMEITCVLFKGTNDVQVGTFSPNTTQNNSSSITGMSSAPKIGFFTCNGATISGGAIAQAITCNGVAVDDGSASQRTHMWYNEDNQADVDCGGYLASSRCMGQFFNGSLSWSGELTSWNSDGATITTRDGGTGGDEVVYMLMDAPSTNLDLQTIDSNTSAATKKYTTSFSVDAVIGAMSHATAVDTVGSDETISQFAASDGAGEESVASGDDHASPDSDTYNLTDAKVVATAIESGGSYGKFLEANVSSYDSDGITFNWTTVDGTARKGWMLSVGSAGTGIARPLVNGGLQGLVNNPLVG